MAYRNAEIDVQYLAVRPSSFGALGLTQRETDVLRWVVVGKTNAEIGFLLNISPRTVQKHLEHIFGKLGVETRTAATMWALDRLASQIS